MGSGAAAVAERACQHRCVSSEPVGANAGGGVGVAACRGGVGGSIVGAVGPGTTAAVAGGQTQRFATGNPGSRNPGGFRANGTTARVSATPLILGETRCRWLIYHKKYRTFQ